MQHFKDLLRELRQKAGLTQEGLAERAGIPLPSLRGHEQGQRLPSWASVVKLAKALEVSTDVFSGCVEVNATEPAKPSGKGRPAKKAEEPAPEPKRGKGRPKKE